MNFARGQVRSALIAGKRCMLARDTQANAKHLSIFKRDHKKQPSCIDTHEGCAGLEP
jgi:hypothetical protein